MTQPHVARLFRSPELGRLATLAAAQGWDVARLPGGHVAATNPTNGARVLMSGTGYVNHGTMRAKVHEFVQAGLDPDWTRKGERARQRQEVRTVQVSAVERAAPAPITPTGDSHTVRRRTPDSRSKGGRYAFVGPLEVLDVGGHEVRLGVRADGKYVGSAKDLNQRQSRRTWYGPDRDTVLARAAEDLVARPPRTEGTPARTVAIRKAQAEAAAPAPAPVPEAVPAGRLDRVLRKAQPPVAPGFHVVQADAAEFPLAAGLDALEATVAPAVEALRAAGRADAADLLTEAAAPMSPVERELLAVYRRLMRGE